MHFLTKFSLQSRFYALAIIGLGSLLGLFVWEGNRAIDTAIRITLEERLNLARATAMQLDRQLERTLVRMGQAATLLSSIQQDNDSKGVQEELRQLYRPDLFKYVFLLDKEGFIFRMEPHQSHLAGKRLEVPCIEKVLQTGKPCVTCMACAVTLLDQVAVLIVPVLGREGGVTGLLGAAIEPSSTFSVQTLKRVVPGRTGYAQVVNDKGLVMAHTAGKEIFKKSERADLFVSLIKEKKAVVRANQVSEEGKGALWKVIAFVPLTQAPWGLDIEQDKDELMAPALDLRRKIYFYAVLILGAAFLIIWFAARRFVLTPLHRLEAASGRIAGGDLTTPVPSMGEDEIGRLGCRFEEMRQRLAGWGEELEKKIEERTEEIRRQHRDLSVLYSIARSASQSMELEEILEQSLEVTLQALGVEAGGFFLLDPGGETLTLHIHRGLSPEFVEAVHRIRFGEGVSGLAVAERRPVVVDFAEYPTERLIPVLAKEGIQTIASTPLLTAGEMVGALNLATRRPHAFLPEEEALLAAIGQQLGQAVRNARLYEKAQQRLVRLETLREIDSSIIRNHDLTAILTAVLKGVPPGLGADAVAISLFREEVKQAKLFMMHLPNGTIVSERAFTLSESLLDCVKQQKEPVIIYDLNQDPRVEMHGEVLRQHRLHSYLGVGLVVRESTIGILHIFSTQPKVYREEDVAFFETLAGQAAIAVENARVNEQLRKSEARYRTLVEISPDAIILMDLKLDIMVANQEALRLSGYRSVDDVVGKNVSYFIATEDRPRVAGQAKEFLEAGQSQNLEYTLLRKDGTPIAVEFRASLVRGAAGETEAIIGIFRDITQRKRAEDQIKDSLREKEVLLAEIHHRVKNNMQIISSLLRLQSRQIKNKEFNRILEESNNRIRGMALIHEKLYQSRDFARVDFADYIGTLTRDLYRSYDVSSETIALNIRCKSLFLGIDTAIPCGLILNELISNALKHAFPEGKKGEVHVELHAGDDRVTLVVKDNGIGFPQDVDFRKPESLGLSLVVLLAEQIDAAIELGREGGTEFRMSFRPGARRGYLSNG